MSNETAAGNPPSADVAWYIDLDERIDADPDWAHQWLALHIDDPSDAFKALYDRAVDALYGHPDAARGRALAWQLHDAIRAVYADRAWLRTVGAERKLLAEQLQAERRRAAIRSCNPWAGSVR